MVIPESAFNKYQQSVDVKFIKNYALPVVFVLGKPGSGKASFCQSLKNDLDYHHLSMSQIIRDEASTNTTRGCLLRQHLTSARNKPIPDDLVFELLREELGKALYRHKPIVIQGFPRNYAQALKYEKELCVMKHVLYFKASDETVRQRALHKNRFIDSNIAEEEFERYLSVFKKHTESVIKSLAENGRVAEIDAEGDRDQVLEEAGQWYWKWFRKSRQGTAYLADPKSFNGREL